MPNVIGICGGIASGKSLVTEILRELGAEVLDADKAGHQVLNEPQVIRQLTDRWGSEILSESKTVDRAQVATIVFADPPQGPQELEFLEKITHPRIRLQLENELQRIANLGAAKMVVLDAPVMFKAGWDEMCDTIIFVDTPHQQRVERARQRGWTEADFDAREAAQDSLENKRSRADVIIDNSRTPEFASKQVHEFWNGLE